MANTPTPHIGAQKGEIAETVIMAGDPLRIKFIAENYLENPVQFNSVRNMLGYTGTVRGKRVSVMGHGMGIPSIGIYAWELFGAYGVQRILRIGTAGALADELQLKDLVLAQGACTDSRFMKQFKLPGSFAPIGDFGLLKKAEALARERGLPVHVGNVLSSDTFYSASPEDQDRWKRMGVLAVEMEAAGLYAVAAYHGRQALAICTVSDHLYRDEQLNSADRERGVDDMIELALDVACE